VLEVADISAARAYWHSKVLSEGRKEDGIVGPLTVGTDQVWLTDGSLHHSLDFTAKVRALDPDLESGLPYLLALLEIADDKDHLAGMDAKLRTSRTLDIVARVLLTESINRPLLLMVEDLHSEETVQALFDEGALERQNGTVMLVRPRGSLIIPPTVQAILAARIDRLHNDEKNPLQTLAILGREFVLSLARAVAGRSEDELERLLARVQQGEFVYEQPLIVDVEYTFKHALTQEVVYNSVLLERQATA
jgi:hypothetical protein